MDLIERQAVIENIRMWLKHNGYSEGERNVMGCTIQMVEALPSAEPEIIRCKDCKYYDGRPCGIVDYYNTESDFCGRSERRTNE